MVANHQGYEIEKSDWNLVSKEWLELFKDEEYLKVDDKPLIIFFSLNSLIKNFGSTEKVKIAFDSLRYTAVKLGLKGVSFAICLNPSTINVKQAESCGFDILTGYNYHTAGFVGRRQQIPIDSLIVSERKIWNSFTNLSKLNYIPVSTLNWDPRPWANKTNNYDKKPYYVGFSPETVYRSVKNCVDWLKENYKFTPKEKLAILYAWNEYGEGAYLTRTKQNVRMAQKIRSAINSK